MLFRLLLVLILLLAPVTGAPIGNRNMRSIPENKIQGEDDIVLPNNSQDLTVNIAIGACLAFILVITVAAISTLIYRLWKNKKSRRDEEGQSHADEDRECHDDLYSLCSGKPNEHQEDMVNIPPPPPPLPSYHTLFGQGADMNRSEGSMSDDKKDCDLQPQQTQEMPELHLDDLAGEWALPPVMDGWDRVTSADEGEEDTEDILLPRNIHTCQCGNMPFRVQLFVYFKTKDGDLLPM
ncbi:uncharacterized protein ACNLHF_025142 isoform 2-T2 [Anomaloglossus baeobatrachus]